MKNKLIVILSCLVLLLSAVAAAASEGPYLSGSAGVSWLSDAEFEERTPAGKVETDFEFDSGIYYSGAAGYDFGVVRGELEVGYQSHDIDDMTDFTLNGVNRGDFEVDADLSAFFVLVNGFVDIDTGSLVTPYAGVGIGGARLSVDDVSVLGISLGDEDDTVFAYQAAAGLAFEITKMITIDVGYRFLGTTEADFDGAELEYYGHNVIGGIRLTFE